MSWVLRKVNFVLFGCYFPSRKIKRQSKEAEDEEGVVMTGMVFFLETKGSAVREHKSIYSLHFPPETRCRDKM